MPLRWTQTHITVSGYPPVDALALCNDGEMLAKAMVASLCQASADLARAFLSGIQAPRIRQPPVWLAGSRTHYNCAHCGAVIGKEQRHGLCVHCLELRGTAPCSNRDCRRRFIRGADTDTSLGFPMFCPACVPSMVAECRETNGRLPRWDEFYCVRCQRIKRKTSLQKPEPNGWQRFRCAHCRYLEVRAADLRRRAKRKGMNGHRSRTD